MTRRVADEVGSGADDIRARTHDPRYQRLMAATRQAARGGYDAVSMRKLAATCQMSMTTIYRFCASKDQLIAEAHVDQMRTFGAGISARPPRGTTARRRVAGVMRAYATALEVDEELSRTLMRAMYSLDPQVADARAAVGTSFARMIDAAIGPEHVEDRAAVIATLGHVVDSVILNWLSRGQDTAWVRRQLGNAVSALFPQPPP